jgi:hypothetical protein
LLELLNLFNFLILLNLLLFKLNASLIKTPAK